jgi:hypothetical protein
MITKYDNWISENNDEDKKQYHLGYKAGFRPDGNKLDPIIVNNDTNEHNFISGEIAFAESRIINGDDNKNEVRYWASINKNKDGFFVKWFDKNGEHTSDILDDHTVNTKFNNVVWDMDLDIHFNALQESLFIEHTDTINDQEIREELEAKLIEAEEACGDIQFKHARGVDIDNPNPIYGIITIKNEPYQAKLEDGLLHIIDFPIDNASEHNMSPGFLGTVQELVNVLSTL